MTLARGLPFVFRTSAPIKTITAIVANVMIILSILYVSFRKNEKAVAFTANCINNVRKLVGMPLSSAASAL